jgi:hypothetical protein
MPKQSQKPKTEPIDTPGNNSLSFNSSVMLEEIRELILTARERLATFVNAEQTLLYWQVGERIRREVLKERRAKYGTEIISSLGKDLTIEFGRGFSEKSLRHMLRFAEAFPDLEIVSSLLRQLSWTHFLSLIY